jgi:hypothetical protein
MDLYRSVEPGLRDTWPFDLDLDPIDILKFRGFRAQKREILTSRWIPTPRSLGSPPAPAQDRWRGASPPSSHLRGDAAPFPSGCFRWRSGSPRRSFATRFVSQILILQRSSESVVVNLTVLGQRANHRPQTHVATLPRRGRLPAHATRTSEAEPAAERPPRSPPAKRRWRAWRSRLGWTSP